MTKEELINLAKTSTDIEQLLTLSFGDIDCKGKPYKIDVIFGCED